MSCGTALEARRNSDERWTFTPSSRNYTFSGMAPLFTVRRGETVLLQIDQTQTVNGSLFSVVGDSVVLQLKKGDAALLDGPTPDTDAEALFYDVTLTDQTGFENWIVGGPFTLLGLNDVSCGGCNEKVEVTLGGQCIQINIEGGNLGIGASVNLAALNQAVQDSEAAATEAEIAAQQAEAARDDVVNGLAAKANKDGSDITSGADWRTALALGDAATSNVGTTAGTVAAGDDARIVAVDSKQDRVSRLPQAYGAVGDGVTNDATALLATMTAAGVDGLVDGKKLRYGVAGNALLVPAGLTLLGVSLNRISGTGQSVRMDEAGATLENLIIDNKASDGNRSGHGVRITADDASLRNVSVVDFGSMDGIGGGTGVIVSNFGGAFRPQRPTLEGLRLKGNLSSQISVGWLFDNVDFGVADSILAENIVGSSGIGYAHELKNGSRYNSLSRLRTNFAEVGLAYGQEGAAIGDGASYNVATNVVSNAVDRGYVGGKGIGNVFVGAVSRADGRPGQAAQFYAMELQDQQREVHVAHAAYGAAVGDRGVLLSGASTKNFVQVASHVADATLIRITDTSRDNVIDVLHPGDKISILGTVNDTSGAPSHGAGANVVYSLATGEQLGTLSGRFRWYLGNPGAAFTAGTRFQIARDGTALLGIGTPATAGLQAGIIHATPANGTSAQIVHTLGATEDANNWTMAVAGASRYVWTATAFRPNTDNSVALGAASYRYTELFCLNPTINTSDEREKQDIGAIPDEWLDAWGDVEWSRFKWKDAVAEKGAEARWHIGLIAQRVRDAFAARGLDAFEIGLLCYDEWEAKDAVFSEDIDEETGETIRTEVSPAVEAGDSYGVRYTEALAMEAAWVRREIRRR